MRGFSEEEREQIREDLIQTGREQFLRYGPERTRVKDITEPVGIAKPTFYQFFDSKGELYLEIMARETEAFSEQLRSNLTNVEDPYEGLKRVFTSYVEFFENKPDLIEVLSENHPRELFRNVPQERIDEVKQQWYSATLPIIEDLQKRSGGSLAEHDPAAILSLLRPVGLMQLYKEQGTTRSEADFERIQDFHIETIVWGLVADDTAGGA